MKGGTLAELCEAVVQVVCEGTVVAATEGTCTGKKHRRGQILTSRLFGSNMGKMVIDYAPTPSL